MTIHSTQSYLIKNSKEQFFNFYIKENEGLTYDVFDKHGKYINTMSLFSSKIIDFSTDIDKNDKIHVLLLTHDGQLLYYIYNNTNWTNSLLSKFNVKSNKYKYLTLKIINDQIHIFYSYCNLINSKVWSLKHIIGSKKKWEKRNIISITPGKYMSPFYIDFDKFYNIHLIYKNTLDKTQQIFYTSYNSFLNKWRQSPVKITDSNVDCLHPHMFIDTKNNIHLIWCIINNNNFTMQYKKLPSLENKKFKWLNINIPINQSNISHPIVFEQNGMLKIVYKQNNTLKTLSSKDYGYSWEINQNTESIQIDSLNLIKYCTNYSFEKMKNKVNYIYGDIKSSVNLYYLDMTKNDTINNNINSIRNTKQNKVISSFNNNSPKLKNISTQNEDTSNNKSTINKSTKNEIKNILTDEDINKFINEITNKLEEIISNQNNLNIIKQNFEEIIKEKSAQLENNLTNNKEFARRIENYLAAIENAIDRYKKDNQKITNLINDIDNKNHERNKKIIGIEKQLQEIKENIYTSPLSQIFNKITKIFK